MANGESQYVILIIDDDAFMQKRMQFFLEREGHQVICANNGETGIQTFLQEKPNLILLDAVMEGMNGFDCCCQITKMPQAKDTPVLMITGLNDQESVDRAFAAGAVDYVTKPIHWPVLRQRVKRLLEQVQAKLEQLKAQKALEIANEKLKAMVTIDGLTQIANRRRFDEYLAQQWMRLAKEELPLSLILIDVDDFKLYNNAYGSESGDYCLKKLAITFSESLKNPTDVVARYSGQRFMAILPRTHAKVAIEIAEKIRYNVNNLKIIHGRSSVGPYVTISLGVTTLIPVIASQEVNIELLINSVHEALQQAKKLGKNRKHYIKPNG
jgi:diguanylate cyclase (GGDEF)-like protein